MLQNFCTKLYKQIPHLIDSGVHVDFDFRMPATLLKSSGDDQEGLTLATLPSPFVVLVLDQNGDPFEGIPVTFSVFWGGGSLDMKNTATDAGGLAQATLTLGPNPGKNRVEVTATGIPTTVTFTAIGLGANTILPVSFWPGDGHANDTVGENHGTLTNGATFAPGLVNQAFSFDGSDDYVVVPAPGSPSLEITDAITIQAWIYPTEIKRQHIVRKTGSAFEAPYDLFLSADNYIAFTLNVNGEWTQCLKSSYPINAWTHVAGTFDGSTMNLYVDGTLEDSLTSEGVLNTLGGPLLIGTRLGLPADTFNGLIDEVVIYNGAMDADDIRDIWLAHSVEENTLVGNDVVVKPVDPVTGTQPVTVTFGQVTADGMTTVTTTDTGPTPPTGFYLAGTHYDLATTASYTGSVTVCIEYDDSGMTEAEENTLKLYHFENEAWVDVTVPPVDTENNIICGQADSFSPFAVFVAEDTTPPTIVDVSVSPNVLWPANHKMVEVTVEVDAEDNSGRPPLCMIVNVESNELITSPGPGSDNSELDWSFTDDPLVVLLRAERAGGADRRIYTICLGCMDASGNTTTATVNVTVPRDMRKIKKK
jgi:hypothetical protein